MVQHPGRADAGPCVRLWEITGAMPTLRSNPASTAHQVSGRQSRALRDAKFGRAAPSRLYDDLHIVAQGDQEAHEALDGISAEPIGQHG